MDFFLLTIFAIYYAFTFTLLLNYYRVQKAIAKENFKDKNYFVSVIIPMKDSFEGFEECIKSVCEQSYKNYEILFVAESEQDSAVKVAREIVKNYKNARILISGVHEGKTKIAKTHNQIFGVENAKGEVFLFADSDVVFDKNWIKLMVSPLGEKYNGKVINGTTAIFVVIPKGNYAKFMSLTSNQVMFVYNYEFVSQKFAFASSGASMCSFREVFFKCKIPEVWKNEFNDDLLFADTLAKNGFEVYNQRKLLNRTTEEFKNLKELNSKVRRWSFTIAKYSNKKVSLIAVLLSLKYNIFISAFVLIPILYFLGFDLLSLLLLIPMSYFSVSLLRYFLSKIIKDGCESFAFLTPLSHVYWFFWYFYGLVFVREFEWGGKKYRVR